MLIIVVVIGVDSKNRNINILVDMKIGLLIVVIMKTGIINSSNSIVTYRVCVNRSIVVFLK